MSISEAFLLRANFNFTNKSLTNFKPNYTQLSNIPEKQAVLVKDKVNSRHLGVESNLLLRSTE